MKTRQKTGDSALRATDAIDRNATQRAVDLLAVASHEIRTPLGAMLTTAEALLDSGLTRQQAKYATILRDAAAALLTLSNTLLDATADTEFDGRENFRPGELISAIADLYRAQAAAKGLVLEVALTPENDHPVSGFPGPMRQVLINLVDNAVKYTRSGTVQLVLSRDDPARVDVRVCDSGAGISDRERVFHPYARMESGMGRSVGQGLGLWAAKRIAEKLHGDLWVEASSPTGTVFRFSTPVTCCTPWPVETAPQPDRPIRRDPGRPYSILVVDDNEAARALAEVVIAAFGWSVTAVASGLQALDLLNGEGRFDCILTDLAMPDMNGFELAGAVAALKSVKPLPVLAVSANRPTRLGVDLDGTALAGFVEKPYSADGLHRHIVDAVEAAQER